MEYTFRLHTKYRPASLLPHSTQPPTNGKVHLLFSLLLYIETVNLLHPQLSWLIDALGRVDRTEGLGTDFKQ